MLAPVHDCSQIRLKSYCVMMSSVLPVVESSSLSSGAPTPGESTGPELKNLLEALLKLGKQAQTAPTGQSVNSNKIFELKRLINPFNGKSDVEEFIVKINKLITQFGLTPEESKSLYTFSITDEAYGTISGLECESAEDWIAAVQVQLRKRFGRTPFEGYGELIALSLLLIELILLPLKLVTLIRPLSTPSTSALKPGKLFPRHLMLILTKLSKWFLSMVYLLSTQPPRF